MFRVLKDTSTNINLCLGGFLFSLRRSLYKLVEFDMKFYHLRYWKIDIESKVNYLNGLINLGKVSARKKNLIFIKPSEGEDENIFELP